MSVIATDTRGFDESEEWTLITLWLKRFADTFSIDEQVLITAVSETVNSIINGEEDSLSAE